jgi:hypothetical protein
MFTATGDGSCAPNKPGKLSIMSGIHVAPPGFVHRSAADLAKNIGQKGQKFFFRHHVMPLVAPSLLSNIYRCPYTTVKWPTLLTEC